MTPFCEILLNLAKLLLSLLHVAPRGLQCDQQSQYLDVGSMDLSQEDLLRLQTAQFTQLFLQACVLLVHIQPQAIAHRCGAVQLNDYKHSTFNTIQVLVLN